MTSEAKVKLTLAMLNQLESYVDTRDRDGWYYGNKAQFERRHAAIKSWLKVEIRKAKPKREKR